MQINICYEMLKRRSAIKTVIYTTHWKILPTALGQTYHSVSRRVTKMVGNCHACCCQYGQQSCMLWTVRARILHLWRVRAPIS